jgi:2-polyprenyl-3-methyl-5-hydroxy-6-metoxy-1,4-benzoquinol methylase
MTTINQSAVECPVCSSDSHVQFNSYKHNCYACTDCNSIFHVKKQGKYFLEKILPTRLLKKLLPRQAYLRLFHAPETGYERDTFYDSYALESLSDDPVRASQAQQLYDQLEVCGIDFKDKAILDVSGGPGILARALKGRCRKIVVTEFSADAVGAMKQNLGVETVKFDYIQDSLDQVVNGKFDIVLIRSSLIFAGDIDKLLTSIDNILNPDAHVLLETIIPSLGEVFWWQQMEYKFPIIYSQEAIEKYFYKYGYTLVYGYREYGNYNQVKQRTYKTIDRKLFTWLVDYPMMLAYYLVAPKRKIPIDQSTRHKFITQIWRKEYFRQLPVSTMKYRSYTAGSQNQSPHFGFVYNGYLKK